MKKVQKQKKVTLDDLWAYLDESKKRSELEFEKIREEDRQLRESLKEVSRQLGSIGNSNGDVAEEYFQNAFKKNPTLNGEIFNEIDFNLKLSLKKGQISSEYDIVMVNKKSVAIIEIKYHFELKKADLQNVLSKLLNKIETFKAFYPEYKKHKFYLGIASLSFRKNIEKIIQGTGIAIIKQVGDKMVINSENLKAF